MSDYAEWRSLEEEFREFQERRPNLYAAWSSVGNHWMGFGDLEGEEDRFRALVGLAAVTAGHSGGDGAIDCWLKLVQGYLLERKSNNMATGRHARLVKPPGAGPTPPGIDWADPMVERGEIYTIRPLCQASADYCLERALQARSEERTAQASATIVGRKTNNIGQTVRPQPPRMRGRPVAELQAGSEIPSSTEGLEIGWSQGSHSKPRPSDTNQARELDPVRGPQPPAEYGAECDLDSEGIRRRDLLAEYKSATGNPANKRIYEARNSGIHKPQFYQWRRGELPADSATSRNFERFLREKKPPIPRKARA